MGFSTVFCALLLGTFFVSALGQWSQVPGSGRACAGCASWTDFTNHRLYVYGGYQGNFDTPLYELSYTQINESTQSWVTTTYAASAVMPTTAGAVSNSSFHPGHRVYAASAIDTVTNPGDIVRDPIFGFFLLLSPF